jgi:molybdopterin molybdotransferase
MVSVNEARAIIQQSTSEGVVETVPLADALGLTAATEVIAAYDIPAYPQSSMDGYALRFDDRQSELSVVGEMTAGTDRKLEILPNQATRIFTGAPLPEGADTVVMQEKTTITNGKLKIDDPALAYGSHMRPRGSEIKRGEIAFAKGTRLSVAALAFLAGIGVDKIPVYKRPSVTIILTGNELEQPGNPLGFGKVYDANSISLSLALQGAGVKQVRITSATDDIDVLRSCLSTALSNSDIVLLTGGVSVGDYDFVVSAAAGCGVDSRFHKVKQRPGKPLYFGTKGSQLVFGLPGNPSSALTCFYMYVLPALDKVMQTTFSCRQTEARLVNEFKKTPGLTQFVKAHYSGEEVTILNAQESFRLHSFARSNALAELEEDSEYFAPGCRIKVHLLPS